ncbi:alpha/beta fold hydrolase [Altererythrobacter litoralis]|uniref:Alpha/beta hydrolase n=1 Tax=Altererythrobacter litoralis TaxID=3113904 RepID=A0ABU7GHA1_9SPHN|nr:alpha/beta hydrolase [Erythrobacteraceae bacterium 1XM1-14]
MIDAPQQFADQLWHGEVDVSDGIVPILMAGEGPPLILLHGWTLDWRMWLPQVDELGRDFLLVIPDRRGFGRSTAPPDLTKEAEDVERIADFLGFERYSLLGLSQGAAVALDCAHRNGWRIGSLVVSGAPIPSLVQRDEVIDLDRYEALARAGNMDTMRADWSRHELMSHENPATSALVDRILADYQGRDLLAPSSLRGVPRDALAHLPMPLLAMTGARDSQWRRECAQALADISPRGSYALVESAGHLANLDNPESFNRTVMDFLLRCDAATRRA